MCVLCVCVQVRVPTLQQRCDHSATGVNLSSGVIEVVLFGGSTVNFKTMADTIVLRFGEQCWCV